jgi:hypothetical protein
MMRCWVLSLLLGIGVSGGTAKGWIIVLKRYLGVC